MNKYIYFSISIVWIISIEKSLTVLSLWHKKVITYVTMLLVDSPCYSNQNLISQSKIEIWLNCQARSKVIFDNVLRQTLIKTFAACFEERLCDVIENIPIKMLTFVLLFHLKCYLGCM